MYEKVIKLIGKLANGVFLVSCDGLWSIFNEKKLTVFKNLNFKELLEFEC